MSINLPAQTIRETTLLAPDRNLLIIDDHEALRRSLRRAISKHFAQILEAGDQETSLQLIRQMTPGDVIISDLELTGPHNSEGLEIARITRETRPNDLTFILVSGTDLPDKHQKIQEYLKTGIIDAFLSKPYDFGELRNTVRTHLRATLDRHQ
jgi:DNA-binding response OmpR family regulator